MVNRVVGFRKLMQAGLKALKGFRVGTENGLRVVRAVTLKIPGSERLNTRRWSRRTVKLYERYERACGKPGLILAHSVTWAGYAAWLIRERHHVPYLIVEHRSYFVWSTPEARQLVKPFHLPLYELAYRNCGQLVLVSGSLLTGLKVLMPWIEDKITVIPNMIREDMFRLPETPRDTRPFVFLWAGRLEHVKGVDLLLEAARALRSKTSEPFTLRLAGRGSLRTDLELQAGKMGLGEVVRFLGRITREEMQQEYRAANCFVLPTRYEAFGAVLIEAMATGLPVIATRSGGPEHIVTGENGLLVDTENAGQLAGAMERVMTGYETYSQEEISRQAVNKYGQTAVMARYGELFRQLLHD